MIKQIYEAKEVIPEHPLVLDGRPLHNVKYYFVKQIIFVFFNNKKTRLW